MAQRVLRLALEYDGTRYHGFGVQPGLRTVQSVLESALSDVLGHAVRVTPAGRTDAGVHARGQVVSFRTPAVLPAAAIPRALRGRLPADLLAGPARDAPLDFDARRSALRRHYRYTIWTAERPNLWWRHYVVHQPGRLDETAMQEAAVPLVGRHDFASFVGHAAQERCPRSSVRTLERAAWVRDGDFLHFDCTADAFARHMVRNLVGSLLAVGRGKLGAEDLPAVLAARDRRAAGPTAPAHGLTFMRVDYPDDNSDLTHDQESQT